MDRFNALGRGLQLMLVGAVLLLIDMFLPWQDYNVGSLGEFKGWHGFGGVLLGLLTIVLIAWLAVRLAAVDIALPVSATLIAAFLGFLILIVAVLKNLVDDQSTIWSYVGVALAILIAVGAWMQVQETGGVEQLKTELPTMPASSGASAPGATTTPAPPPVAEPMVETPPQSSSAPADTAAPAPPPPPAAPPPMGEPAAPAESTPAEERPASASGVEPSTESSEETR